MYLTPRSDPEQLRLTIEAREARRIGAHVRRQNLHGDLAAKPRVTGAIDLAHATLAERREDFVDTESSAGAKRHDALISQMILRPSR